MDKHSSRKATAVGVVLMTVAAVVVSLVGFGPAASSTTSGDRLAAAWDLAQRAGSYRFTSDVEQTTTPSASILNAGRSSRVDRLHLQGLANVADSAMEFRVWSGGGSVLSESDSLAIRVEDGKTYQRVGTGEWDQTSDFSQMIAPEGDFMSYLVAARDITEIGTETRGPLAITRYRFELDGPTLATSMTENLEQAMRQRGELPAGAKLESPQFYNELIGTGELWVDDRGYPVRQMLSLQFPEQDDEIVSAEITVDFSEFGMLDGSASGGWWQRGLELLPGESAPHAAASLLAFAMGVSAVVFVARRSPWAPVRPLTVVIVMSLVAGPFSEPAVGAAGSRTLTGRADAVDDESERQRQMAELAHAIEAERERALPDPHQSRLAVGSGTLTTAASPDSFGGPESTGSALFLEDDGSDTDGDGLTDFVEERIGTNWEEADTDGDGLDDGVEVNGFELGGRWWYPDPELVDSNGDSIADSIELDAGGDGVPDDTDGDGIPDIFDADNDGDGVPDHKDLAPFFASREGGELQVFGESPLLLSLEGGSSDPTPTFVEFQLRPTDPHHLQFSRSRLDWPSDDQGQIRDVDGSEDELELVPMLEIIAPSDDQFPSQEALRPHAVTVSGLGDPDGGAAAYVPLSLVTDERTGSRVAFAARMLYDSDAEIADHEVRLVWAVQMANDVPCDPTDDACPASGYHHNVPEIVHRYYEPWNLTGIKVSEEHGTQVAVIYEDPTVDADSRDDGPTWLLSDVLTHRFLTHKETSDGPVYEITMDSIDSQIDRIEVGESLDEGIYGLPNVFSVVKHSYPTLGEGVVATSAEVAPSLLESQFDPVWTRDGPIMPLFVTTYEARVRSLSADASAADAPGVVQNANHLTLDLAPAGELPVPVDTIIGLKWSYYCGGSASTPVWEGCEADTVWTTLDERHGAVQLDPEDLTPLEPGDQPLDPDGAAGQNIVMNLYAMAMQQGLQSVSERAYSPSDVRVVSGQFESPDDTTVENGVRSAGVGVRAIAKIIANKYFYDQLKQTYPAVKQIGQLKPSVVRYGKAAFAKFSLTGKALLGLALIAVIGAFATVAVLALAGNETADTALQILTVAIIATTQLAIPIYTIVAIAKSSIEVGQIGGTVAGSTLSLRSELIGKTRQANMIAAVISIGITWGFFLYGVISNGITAFSPEFNQALSEAIAATIFIVMLTLVSLSVVGLIIVGIIALIDGILTLVCELGVDELRSDFTDGGCFTLNAAAIKSIASVLYAYDLMIDTDQPDLVDVGEPAFELVDASLGFIVGNGFDITVPITTNIVHNDPSPESWLVTPYLWFFSETNLRSTTVAYSLTSPEPAELSVERGEMSSRWTDVGVDHTYLEKEMYRATTTEDSELRVPFDDPGLNQEYDFHLNMAYAMPAFECWSVPQPVVPPFMVPVCYQRTFRGEASNPFDPLVYDVFPATLSGFMELGVRSAGRYGLGWDLAFPALPDADHDGALATGLGGLDPDDTLPDSDFDGLTDAFELLRRQEGVAVSPISWDTDGDGLTDAQELEIGSDPAVVDTDNDGLTDAEEVRHLVYVSEPTGPRWNGEMRGGWTVEVGSRSVEVSSDPLRADADGDGLSDEAERALAGASDPEDRVDRENRPYHPDVFNTPPVAVYLRVDDDDGYVAPGQEVLLTSVVEANLPLEPGVLTISATDDQLVFAPYLLDFDPDTFEQVQQFTQQTSLAVPTPVSGTDLALTADVRARLESGPATPPTLRVAAETPIQGSSAGGALFADVDLAAQFAGSPGDYILAETSSTDSVAGGGGDVRAITLPAGTNLALDLDTEPVGPRRTDYRYLRGDQGAAVACNADGMCFTVWEHYDNCNSVTVNYLKVIDQQETSGVGIEPGIYIRRQETGGEFVDDLRLLWFTENNGGNQMQDGQQRGPDADGFPVEAFYCGEAGLAVVEVDGNAALNDDKPKEILKLHDTRGNIFLFDETTALSGTTLRFENDDYHQSEGEAVTKCHNPTFWPNVYCNRVDINVTISDQPRNRVAGAINDGSGTITQPQFDLAPETGPGVHDTAPAVASDGEGFRIAWNRTDNGSTHIMTRTFDAMGAPSSAPRVVATATHETTHIDVTWTGDGYRITWLETTGIGALDSSASLAIRSKDDEGPVQTLASFDVDDRSVVAREDVFDIAHDPVNDCTVLVYSIPGGSTRGRRLGCGGATVDRELFTSASQRRSPHVAFNPLTGGWVLSTQTDSGDLRVDLLDAELGPAASSATSTSVPSSHPVTDSSVACPAPSALPAAELRFEELPGETVFEDSSGYGNDAVAAPATSPDAGVPGAPEADDSDFAIRFDATADELAMPNPVDDEVTLAFWYHAPAADTGEPYVIRTGERGLRLEIDNRSGTVHWSSGADSVSAVPPRLNDGAWHFVAVTRSQAGALAISVDGVTLATSVSSETPVPSSVLAMRGAGSRVSIDHLRVYTAALGEPAIDALRLRRQANFCVAVGATDSDDETAWARLFFDEDDGRGGRVRGEAVLPLTVDSSPPTSQVAPVPTLRPTTLLVGGSADDDLSGVSHVEVRVRRDDGQWGAWQLASGRENWTFQLHATTGAYEIQSRATDAVGNIETPGTPVTVEVDSTAPTVTVDAPPSTPITPGVDTVTGQPVLGLTGTVTDAGSGLSPDAVEVQVVPQGALPEVDRWQTAITTSGVWTVEYPFSASADDVSGAYTILVRATDVAGNRTSDDAATAEVVLDANAPEITLSRRDAERQTITESITIGGQVSDADGAGIASVDVALTPLATVAESDSAVEWSSASLSASGPGVLAAEWSFAIPADTEDFFQVDLRTTDTAGNQAVTSSVWRGIIDNRAPRVTFEIEPTGNVHTNGKRFEINYRCRAEDLFLTVDRFDCPGKELETPVRSFNTDAVFDEFFPDQTILASLETIYTKWENTNAPAVSLTACDLFGSCTSVQAVSGLDATASSASAGPISGSVISPTVGEHVAATGEVEVVVAADAGDGLLVERIEVWVGELDAPGNNRPSAVVDLGNDPKPTVQELVVVDVSAGVETVRLKVVADDGSSVWSGPVEFFVDTAAPSLSLSATSVDSSSSWGPGSDVIRFGGDVGDDGTIAAVQIKVGSYDWTDATFDAARWRTAIQLPDADGSTLSVAVRAIDLAGRTTELSFPAVEIELAPQNYDRPETVIAAGPSSSVTGPYLFEFDGEGGTAAVSGFLCRIDDLPQHACSSPWEVASVPDGSHTLSVAAVDERGYQDLTPATWEWIASSTGPQVTFVTVPPDPSPGGSAAFVFEHQGSGQATFECSLDGAPFIPCASPLELTELRDGSHIFEVRVSVGGETGDPSAHRWRVANLPPLLSDGVLTTVENNDEGEPFSFEDFAFDADDLTYVVVDDPDHGFVEGDAQQGWRYVPFADYYGPDSFRFYADDGQTRSEVATIHVTVQMEDFVIYADESAALGNEVIVVRGGVGVNLADSGAYVARKSELFLGEATEFIHPSSLVVADSIIAKNKSIIQNVTYNEFDNKGTVEGTETATMVNPYQPLPSIPDVQSSGGEDLVVVGTDVLTLPQQAFGVLSVGADSTVVLAGGLYWFDRIEVEAGGRLLFDAPSELRVAGPVHVGAGSEIGPSPRAGGIDAGDLVIYTTGVNAKRGGPRDRPAAVDIGAGSIVHAYVVAPAGTIGLGKDVLATGGFLARWVDVANEVVLNPTPVAEVGLR